MIFNNLIPPTFPTIAGIIKVVAASTALSVAVTAVALTVLGYAAYKCYQCFWQNRHVEDKSGLPQRQQSVIVTREPSMMLRNPSAAINTNSTHHEACELIRLEVNSAPEREPSKLLETVKSEMVAAPQESNLDKWEKLVGGKQFYLSKDSEEDDLLSMGEVEKDNARRPTPKLAKEIDVALGISDNQVPLIIAPLPSFLCDHIDERYAHISITVKDQSVGILYELPALSYTQSVNGTDFTITRDQIHYFTVLSFPGTTEEQLIELVDHADKFIFEGELNIIMHAPKP